MSWREEGNKRWEKEDIDHENELDQKSHLRTQQQDIKINNDERRRWWKHVSAGYFYVLFAYIDFLISYL